MRPATGRTLAQAFCLLLGLALVLVGALGFIANADFGSAHDGKGEFLGLEVNGWHNVVHIVSGLFLLAVRGAPWRARAGTVAFGLVYAVVAVWGLITGDSVFGIVPVDRADNILHVALAVLALVAGAASPSVSYADPDATGTRLTIYRPSHKAPASHRPVPALPGTGGDSRDPRHLTPGDTGGR
jgi:Domain of unknown function (DUF4383)